MKSPFKKIFPISMIAVFAIVLVAGFAKKAESRLDQKNMDLSLCLEDNCLQNANCGLIDKEKNPDVKINYNNLDSPEEKKDKA